MATSNPVLLANELQKYGSEGYGYYAGKRGNNPSWAKTTYNVSDLLSKGLIDDPEGTIEIFKNLGIDIGTISTTPQTSEYGDLVQFQKKNAQAIAPKRTGNPFKDAISQVAGPQLDNSFSKTEVNDIIKQLGTDTITKTILQRGREYQTLFSGDDNTVLGQKYHKAKKGAMDWFTPIFKTGVLGSIAVATGGAASAAVGGGLAGSIAGGAASGATSAGTTGGDILKGALIGAITGGAAKTVTPVISNTLSPTIGKTAAGIVAKGAVGGALSVAKGNDFLTGIVSGSIPSLDFGNRFINTPLNSLFKNSVMNLIRLNKQTQSPRPGTGNQSPTRSISTPQQGQLVNLIRSIYSQRRG